MELSARLREWRGAGLVSDEQVEAITAYEAERAPAPAPVRARRTVAAEAIGYVGAALAVGALLLLLGEVWRNLVVAGRLALVGVLTLLVFGAGAVVAREARPALQRLASVLLTAGVVGTGWLAFVVAEDLAGLRGVDVALAVTGSAGVAALVVYLPRRRALLQLALLVAIAGLVGSLMARPALPPSPLWFGLAFWALGVAWLLLGLGRWLEPPRLAQVFGASAALLAIQLSSFGDARLVLLVLGVSTAAALVVLAMAADAVHHLAVGAVGLFVLVPQLVFELFGDAIGAPATLLVVGLLLVLLAVGIGRARREVVHTAPEGES